MLKFFRSVFKHQLSLSSSQIYSILRLPSHSKYMRLFVDSLYVDLGVYVNSRRIIKVGIVVMMQFRPPGVVCLHAKFFNRKLDLGSAFWLD